METESTNILLAVYGTLRKGFWNHDLIKECQYIGTFKTVPEFFLICLGSYPVLIPETEVSLQEKTELKLNGIAPSKIVYELYSIDKATWEKVCHLEGYSGVRGHKDNDYDTMDIETEKGMAQIFIQKQIISEGNFVASGDYSLFKGVYEKQNNK